MIVVFFAILKLFVHVCNIKFSFLHMFMSYANYDNVVGVYPSSSKKIIVLWEQFSDMKLHIPLEKVRKIWNN